MYAVELDDSRTVRVSRGKHEATYAVDGSLMNPLEAFYATLAGCAAVFAQKACKELGVPARGIRINCRPFAGAGGPLSLSRFKTEVTFPDAFPSEMKGRVLEAIGHCAVKRIVEDGASVTFAVSEATASVATA